MQATFSIVDVNVFDGEAFVRSDVTIRDGMIIFVPQTTSLPLIRCTNKYLIPGLIDCHVHLRGENVLRNLVRHGVTTALDMAAQLQCSIHTMKESAPELGLPTVITTGVPVILRESNYNKTTRLTEYLVPSAAEVEAWVSKRAEQGSDYIKIVSDAPVPPQDVLKALVTAAHHHGQTVVAHASRKTAFDTALHSGADIITHLPLDQPLEETTAAQMKANRQISIPTLSIEEALPAKLGLPLCYLAVQSSFRLLHRTGIPILAGTDANSTPVCPVEHGASLHRELELMVEAGMTPLEALRSATCEPPKYLPGLEGRGVIAHGLRADLVLLTDNPLVDIRNTRSIERVWIGGMEVPRG